MEAIKNDKKEIFDLLLEFCDVNYVTKSNKTALFFATGSQNKYYFEKLLTKTNIDINILNGNKHNPLLNAIDHGFLNYVETLVSFPNIIINVGKYRNNNPLLKALNQRKSKILAAIINSKYFSKNYFIYQILEIPF